jgi:hypothetical protein
MHEGGTSIARRNLLPAQELTVQAHLRRPSAVQPQGRFVSNLNCKSAASPSGGHNISLIQLYSQGRAAESSSPSPANLVNMRYSRLNQASGQGIDLQGHGSRFLEQPLLTVPDPNLSEDLNDGSFPPYSNLFLNRDFSKPEPSCSQTQWPMITSAERGAPESEVRLLLLTDENLLYASYSRRLTKLPLCRGMVLILAHMQRERRLVLFIRAHAVAY